jgi:hypothetical protein
MENSDKRSEGIENEFDWRGVVVGVKPVIARP